MFIKNKRLRSTARLSFSICPLNSQLTSAKTRVPWSTYSIDKIGSYGVCCFLVLISSAYIRMVYVMDAILNCTGNYTTWKQDKMLHTQHKLKHKTTMCTFNVVYFTISMAQYKTAVIQCVSNGVTAVLQLAIDILSLDSGYILRRLHVRCTIYHRLELSYVFYYIKVVQYKRTQHSSLLCCMQFCITLWCAKKDFMLPCLSPARHWMNEFCGR